MPSHIIVACAPASQGDGVLELQRSDASNVSVASGLSASRKSVAFDVDSDDDDGNDDDNNKSDDDDGDDDDSNNNDGDDGGEGSADDDGPPPPVPARGSISPAQHAAADGKPPAVPARGSPAMMRPPPPKTRPAGHQRSKSAGEALHLAAQLASTDGGSVRSSWPSGQAREAPAALTVSPPWGDDDAGSGASSMMQRRDSHLVTEEEIEYFRQKRSQGKSAEELHSAIGRLRRRNRAIQDVNAQLQHELSRVKANRLYLERMLSEHIQQSH